MPQPDFNWLLNPNSPLSEVDTSAAEGAIAMGGMLGSPFAMNNRLRLRDSERMQRLQLGENLLQPYLNRASSEGIAAGNQAIQREQIAAQAASDAMRESGAMARLSTEGQQRLQLALIQGDQQAADRLLTEAGANSRQASQLAAGLQESTQRNQTQLLSSLLPYALPKGGAGAIGPDRSGDGYTDFSGPVGSTSRWVSTAPTTQRGNGGGIGGLGANLGPVLSRILAGYGLTA